MSEWTKDQIELKLDKILQSQATQLDMIVALREQIRKMRDTEQQNMERITRLERKLDLTGMQRKGDTK